MQAANRNGSGAPLRKLQVPFMKTSQERLSFFMLRCADCGRIMAQGSRSRKPDPRQGSGRACSRRFTHGARAAGARQRVSLSVDVILHLLTPGRAIVRPAADQQPHATRVYPTPSGKDAGRGFLRSFAGNPRKQERERILTHKIESELLLFRSFCYNTGRACDGKRMHAALVQRWILC